MPADAAPSDSKPGIDRGGSPLQRGLEGEDDVLAALDIPFDGNGHQRIDACAVHRRRGVVTGPGFAHGNIGLVECMRRHHSAAEQGHGHNRRRGQGTPALAPSSHARQDALLELIGRAHWHVRHRSYPQFPSLRSLHSGWAAVTVAIVVSGTAGALSALWRFTANGEWWNIPGVLVGALLGWWVAVPAWRLARLGRSSVRLGSRSERSGSL